MRKPAPLANFPRSGIRNTCSATGYPGNLAPGSPGAVNLPAASRREIDASEIARGPGVWLAPSVSGPLESPCRQGSSLSRGGGTYAEPFMRRANAGNPSSPAKPAPRPPHSRHWIRRPQRPIRSFFAYQSPRMDRATHAGSGTVPWSLFATRKMSGRAARSGGKGVGRRASV